MGLETDFLEAVKKRRSRYALTEQSPLKRTELEALIKTCVKYAPSAFNSQGARLLVLFGKQHHLFWQMVKDILRERVPADKFGATEQKLDSFSAGYGTVLFFEDHAAAAKLQEEFPAYRDTFPVWALQSNGMLEYIVWTALEAAGFGASLQHYNPLVDEAVRRTFGVPESWALLAQMPFGVPFAPPQEKTFLPLDERVKFIG